MAEPGLIIQVHDLDTDEVADISEICLVRKGVARANLPRQFVVTFPAAHTLVAGNHDDDFRKIGVGDRKLLVWEEDRATAPIFHGRIDKVERVGNGIENLTTVTAYDPLVELGSEASDRAGRYVRDATGNFIFPEFGATITGAQFIYEALVNSQQTGVESGPTPGEGPLPIHVDEDNFDSTVNLSMDNFMSWPLKIGDLISMLVSTGVLDFYLRPADPTDGFDAYVMVEAFAADVWGTDRSATVHFDYWTGSKNAGKAMHVEDFATVCNKLYDYLGPPVQPPTRWADNITPGAPGTTIDPTDSRDRYRTQLHQIRFFDQFAPTHTDPFALAAWNGEAGYRLFPREILQIEPVAGSEALYRPWGRDFDVGDVVAQNVGAALGIEIAADQRVLGWDAEWDEDNVQTVTKLYTSADVSL